MRNVNGNGSISIGQCVIKHAVGHVNHDIESIHANDNSIIFAATVLVLHTIKTAYELFFQKVLVTKDNTPSMPLPEAHLEGFFILGYSHE